jgi:hypothetical protein
MGSVLARYNYRHRFDLFTHDLATDVRRFFESFSLSCQRFQDIECPHNHRPTAIPAPTSLASRSF